MKKPIYESHKHNSNILVEVTDRIEEEKLTEIIAGSKGYNPTPVVPIKIKNPPIYSASCFVFLPDSHTGTIGVNEIREKKAIEFMRVTSNAYVSLPGDILNITGGVDNHSEAKYSNQRAVNRKVKLYGNIVHKIVAIHEGNHDGQNGNRNLANNANFARHVADKLGVPFVEFGALYQLELPTDDYRRSLVGVDMYVTHMSGKTSGAAKSADITQDRGIKTLRELGIIPDIIVGGHFHSNTGNIIRLEAPEYDKKGKMIGKKKKDVLTISESTLQEISRYGVTAGYSASDSNVYINDIRVVKNALYNTKTADVEDKYKVEVTRFPMFRENSNDYTHEALEYMEAYKEPFHLEKLVREKYQGMSAMESIVKLSEEFLGKKPEAMLDNGLEMTKTKGE